MSNAPESKWLTPNGGLPTGNGWDKSQLVEYTRTDIHDTAKARIAELENKLKLAASALDEASEYSSGLKSYADNLRAALKVTT
jgi:hypothetical protein